MDDAKRYRFSALSLLTLAELASALVAGCASQKADQAGAKGGKDPLCSTQVVRPHGWLVTLPLRKGESGSAGVNFPADGRDARYNGVSLHVPSAPYPGQNYYILASAGGYGIKYKGKTRNLDGVALMVVGAKRPYHEIVERGSPRCVMNDPPAEKSIFNEVSTWPRIVFKGKDYDIVAFRRHVFKLEEGTDYVIERKDGDTIVYVRGVHKAIFYWVEREPGESARDGGVGGSVRVRGSLAALDVNPFVERSRPWAVR